MNFTDALNIDDLQQIAHRRLPRFVVDYIESGADDEVSLRRNRAAFERIELQPRGLVNIAQRDRSVTLFGKVIASPMIIAPMGFTGLVRPQTDLMLAKAAAAAGIPFALSTASNVGLDRIAREVTGSLWFQLSAMRDRSVTQGLIERAREAGYDALVLTIDGTVYGKRTRDKRNYTSSSALRLEQKLDVLFHPAWLWRWIASGGPPAFENVADFLPPDQRSMKASATFLSQGKDQTLAWDDLQWLRELWPRTFILKGVLNVQDANKAAGLGIDGIVLSNHGGRQLDGTVAPIELLPKIAAAVGERIAILMDGGIRRGTDVVKALSLGARAVMIGRPMLYGAAAGGQAGAQKAIEILNDEVDRTLGLLGCPRASELSANFLHLRDEGSNR